jgi:hypothetical protein
MLFHTDLHQFQPLDIRAGHGHSWLMRPTRHLYDVYYLALAEQADCDLWTMDRRLMRPVAHRSHRHRWVCHLPDEQ